MRLFFDLYLTFFKIGIVTFGGGLTMLPLLERTLVNDKDWVTLDELLDYYSISQTTPGIIAINVSTFVGYKKLGVIGGIAATLGMVTPSIIIISLIAKFVANFESIVWVQKAMKGINASVAALLFSAVITLGRKNLKTLFSCIVFLAAFIGMYFLKVHTLILTLSGMFIGLVMYVISRKNPAEGEKK